MGASQRKPDPINLLIRKSGWAIPAGTAVSVRASFPDGSGMDLPGTGHGQVIQMSLPSDQVATWVHHLTASPSMQLSFEGSEPAWNFDLAGTTKVVNAMGDCFAAHQIAGVAPPFSKSAVSPGGTEPFGNQQTASLAAGSPTQPVAKSVAIDVSPATPRNRPPDEEKVSIEARNAEEDSPDNVCKQPDMARHIMQNFSDFRLIKEFDAKILDIEHLTTISSNKDKGELACHGTFVLDNGVRLTGVYEIKPNVAGDLIASWTLDR